MPRTQYPKLGRRLSLAAFGCGIVGIPLWLLSYVWVLFRFAGRETEAVWNVVIAGEVGAMFAVLCGTITGAIACQHVVSGGEDFRRASSGMRLSAAVFICLVLFNLIGIIFFS